MSVEKRKGEKAIPDNLSDYLNDLQLMILDNIGRIGWSLQFVRRPLGESPIAVIGNKEGNNFCVLEDSGSVNFKTGVLIRADQELRKAASS